MSEHVDTNDDKTAFVFDAQHEIRNWTQPPNISIPKITVSFNTNTTKVQQQRLLNGLQEFLRARLDKYHIEGGVAIPFVGCVHFHGPILQNITDQHDQILELIMNDIKSLFTLTE